LKYRFEREYFYDSLYDFTLVKNQKEESMKETKKMTASSIHFLSDSGIKNNHIHSIFSILYFSTDFYGIAASFIPRKRTEHTKIIEYLCSSVETQRALGSVGGTINTRMKFI
jgi:gamma-glutamyltranspeptidase